MRLIDALQPDSPYVFYSDDHGFCINTADVMDFLTMDKESVIYRQSEAIGHLKNIAIYSFQDGYTDEARQAIDMAIKALEELERKKGRWKLLNNGDAICSECGRRQKGVWDFDNWDNFCRHCGADMRGDGE